MARPTKLLPIASLAFLALACARDPALSVAGTGGAPVVTGTGGAGTGGAPATGTGGVMGTGGATGTGGVDGTGGATGAGGSFAGCDNSDPTVIPIGKTARYESGCNLYGIQGSWYCFQDMLGASSCSTGKPPYVPARGGMCITGTTSTAAAAYGAGVGAELDATGGAAPLKSPFDAAAAGIVGFAVTITGTSNVGLRLTFTGTPTTTATQPFVDLPGAGTYQVLLADAVVPRSFSDTTAGARVDPHALYAVELSVPRTDVVATYDYCITRLQPLRAGDVTPPPTTCAPPTASGAAVCGPQDLLGEIGPYAAQNNVNAGATGSQCVQALAGGRCAGFVATFGNGGFGSATADTPSSYPSLVYGWQGGTFYGGYRVARTLGTIAAVPTTWAFAPPASGKWNASYDLWLAPQPAPATAAGGLELMIWPAYGGGAMPAGVKPVVRKTIAGADWDVWIDAAHTVGGKTWTYLAYQRAPSDATALSIDLKAFLDDALTEGAGTLSQGWYLLGVQAGFEVWQGVAPVTSSRFSVDVQ